MFSPEQQGRAFGPLLIHQNNKFLNKFKIVVIITLKIVGVVNLYTCCTQAVILESTASAVSNTVGLEPSFSTTLSLQRIGALNVCYFVSYIS